MKVSKTKQVKVQSYIKGHDQPQQFQRCQLCNVKIFRNPCSDSRSETTFNGMGNILCNKCAATLEKMPSEQALHALNNAYEMYKKDKDKFEQ